MQPQHSSRYSHVPEESLFNLQRKCRDSMNSSLQTTSDSLKASTETSRKLTQQSEKLQKIHADTEKIEENLDSTEYLLHGMKSWWSSFSQYFTTPPSKLRPPVEAGFSVTSGKEGSDSRETSALPLPTKSEKVNNKSRLNLKEPPSIHSKPQLSPHTEKGTQKASQKASRDLNDTLHLLKWYSFIECPYFDFNDKRNCFLFEKDSFDGELDANLDQLSDMLGDLHSQAVAMNTTIGQQNSLLNEINENVEKNNSRIGFQRKDVETLLRR
ncbi:hypothetical protein IE077_003985 [Cardiosporidium cionae]|uniref:t-SNARE coiled-coil homology domain-containing protein n=1 Tax=Cardiosporidium cionae TaxID=476202 RepID=A0ABQ7JEB9_9APIC|nr:hypothetical protein IE077_003985 [Cardiosporidium cionae]|eukprot:KAF8822331.1 hypothetical protein IE077_003985 [Cardiosporidium cionae]